MLARSAQSAEGAKVGEEYEKIKEAKFKYKVE
jgi:hypothetical protein